MAVVAVVVAAVAAGAITVAALTVGAVAANASGGPVALATHGAKKDVPRELPMPVVPLLTITVTDGVTAPRAGESVTYTVTLTNRDRLELPMVVRLTPPAGLSGARAADGGSVAGAALGWPVTLAPGGRTVLHFTAKVAEPAKGGRLAVTACSYIDGSDRPTACASDLDQVAAGQSVSWRGLAWTGGVIVALLVGMGLWRRLRPAPAPARTATEDPSVALARQVVAEMQAGRQAAEPAGSADEPAASGTPNR